MILIRPINHRDDCEKKRKLIGDKGKCCCNCEFHYKVMGHPCVTNTSIMTFTGLCVCTALDRDGEHEHIASGKHGLCEEWALHT